VGLACAPEPGPLPAWVASPAGKADDTGQLVPADHWSLDAVNALVADGVIPVSAELYRPEELLTREALVRLLVRAKLNTSGVKAGGPGEVLTVAETVVSLGQALGWAPASQGLGDLVVQGARIDAHGAAPLLRAAANEGVLALEANPRNLEPDRPATRGEAAAMLYLALRRTGALAGPLPAALARHQLPTTGALTPALRFNREANLADSDRFFDAWWESNGIVGTFTGRAGWSIAFGEVVHPEERGALIVLPGYSESFRKYAELAYDFYGLGFSVYGMDHRGQAGSGRFLADWNKAYIDDFDHFVDDLQTLIQQRIQRPGRMLYIYAHSQGAGIATLYMERHPTQITAAVLSSPMHQLKLPVWERPAHWLVSWGDPEDYAMGKGPYKRWTFAECTVTRSLARFRRAQQLLDDRPELRLGGQTNQWVREAIEATWRMGDDAHKLATPLLLLQADDDAFVAPGRQHKICQRAQDCTLHRLPAGSRHELYQEVDPVRADALQRAYQHFLTHP
jgi:lysophospholipase